ncbi:MAG: DUF2490 domain-containing protein [Bacteroidia bacterium]
MKKLLILGFLFIFNWPQLFAQEKFVDDASLWLGLQLEKKVNKKMQLQFSNQIRYDRNLSRYRMGYQDLGLEYHVFKLLYVQADYKFIHRQLLDESFSYRHQMNLSFLLKKKFGSWIFTYKNRWQWQYNDVNSSADGFIPQVVNRNKLSVKYALDKRIKFFGSGELNYILKPAKDESWDRYRTSMGLEYQLNRNSSLELYYTFQRDLETDIETERFHIYGLTYSIKL